jgi:hypothetical protein
MRHIHIAEGVRLRFPARNEDFNQGVEIGMLAVQMSQENAEFRRRVSSANLGQVRALAEKLGYRVIEGPDDGEWIELNFYSGTARPRLRVVHSGT